MTKKSKNSDNNKLPFKSTKIVDYYTDMFFLKEKPVSEAFIERLAQEMIDWSKEDDALRITQFFNKRGIPNPMLYRWMEKYPFFKQAHEYVMAVIADRRDVGAITRKYDGNYIDKSLGMYDPEYRKYMEWKASLTNKEKESQGTVVVQMMPSPTSDVVPERKRVDE